MALVSEGSQLDGQHGRLDVGTVRAVTPVKKMKGGSQSMLFDCDDGKSYVVKFNDGTKNVANEFVGSEIALALGLPAPRHALVEINQGLIDADPELKQRNIKPGIHHGTVFEPTALDLDARGLDPRTITLENAKDVSGVIAFDNLMINTDRNNSGNNLFFQASSTSYTYMMCDYNCIFTGNSWTAPTLASSVTFPNLVPVHPILANTITGATQFEDALTRIEGLQTGSTVTIVNNIPQTWTISSAERAAIINFLEGRKSRVREIILRNRPAFPRWTVPAEPARA